MSDRMPLRPVKTSGAMVRGVPTILEAMTSSVPPMIFERPKSMYLNAILSPERCTMAFFGAMSRAMQ